MYNISSRNTILLFTGRIGAGPDLDVACCKKDTRETRVREFQNSYESSKVPELYTSEHCKPHVLHH